MSWKFVLQFGVFLSHLNRGSSTWSRHTHSERREGAEREAGGRGGGALRATMWERRQRQWVCLSFPLAVCVCARACISKCVSVCVCERSCDQAALSHLLESRRFSCRSAASWTRTAGAVREIKAHAGLKLIIIFYYYLKLYCFNCEKKAVLKRPVRNPRKSCFLRSSDGFDLKADRTRAAAES